MCSLACHFGSWQPLAWIIDGERPLRARKRRDIIAAVCATEAPRTSTFVSAHVGVPMRSECREFLRRGDGVRRRYGLTLQLMTRVLRRLEMLRDDERVWAEALASRLAVLLLDAASTKLCETSGKRRGADVEGSVSQQLSCQRAVDAASRNSPLGACVS